jgi:hypothetical protein
LSPLANLLRPPLFASNAQTGAAASLPKATG